MAPRSIWTEVFFRFCILVVGSLYHTSWLFLKVNTFEMFSGKKVAYWCGKGAQKAWQKDQKVALFRTFVLEISGLFSECDEKVAGLGFWRLIARERNRLELMPRERSLLGLVIWWGRGGAWLSHATTGSKNRWQLSHPLHLTVGN